MFRKRIAKDGVLIWKYLATDNLRRLTMNGISVVRDWVQNMDVWGMLSLVSEFGWLEWLMVGLSVKAFVMMLIDYSWDRDRSVVSWIIGVVWYGVWSVVYGVCGGISMWLCGVWIWRMFS